MNLSNQRHDLLLNGYNRGHFNRLDGTQIK
jgi:hypothetical protein